MLINVQVPTVIGITKQQIEYLMSWKQEKSLFFNFLVFMSTCSCNGMLS